MLVSHPLPSDTSPRLRLTQLPAWRAYGLATVVTVLALATLVLQASWLTSLSLVWLVAAVAISAWYGGFGPGALAVSLSALVSAFLLLPPPTTFAVEALDDQVRLAGFILVGLLTSGLTASLRAAQRRAELAWQHYHELVHNLEAVIWEGDPVAERYLFINQRVEPVLGYPLAQWLAEDRRLWGACLHPGDRARVLAERRAVVETRRAREIEYRALTRDGRLLWLREIIDLARAGSRPAAVIRGVTIDITDRKEAELAASAGAARLRLLAEASEHLAGSLDAAASLDGFAQLLVPLLADLCLVDLVGEDQTLRSVAVAHSPAIPADIEPVVRRGRPLDPTALAGVARVVRTGQPELAPTVDDDWWAATGDAMHQHVLQPLGVISAMIVPLMVQDRVLGAISLLVVPPNEPYGPVDLVVAEELARRAALAADHARLYQEARAAVHARDLFLSIAAHEFRTPLTSLHGALQLLTRAHTRGRLDEAWLADQLPLLSRSVERLVALVNDLLDVARWRLGQFPHRPRAIDLAGLVRQVVNRYADYDDGRLELVIAPSMTWTTVAGDAMGLDQVVTNVLDNALKYSSDGGQIRIVLQRVVPSDGVQLTVQDEGIGVPPELLEQIFEPFGRAPNAMERRVPGTGLGLYICRLIVQNHGGRIWAESAGVGQGTTVRVWLPTGAPDLTADPVNSTE